MKKTNENQFYGFTTFDFIYLNLIYEHFGEHKNEQEEKILLAFLDSLRYDYQSGIEDENDQTNTAFINRYNLEIDQADSEIESGDFVKHDDVEQFFHQRRKAL